MALKSALTDPIESWEFKKNTPSIQLGSSDSDSQGFLLSSRAGKNGEGFEVLTVGDIACSPQELVSVLCSHDENDYNSAMKGLYGNQFIYGSVVHVLDHDEIPKNHKIVVRTGCFARSRLLARNEQWCFLEYFQPSSDEGFSVSLLSLPERELAAGKVIGNRVDQLDNISALLVVDSIPTESNDYPNKVRIIFHMLHGKGERAVRLESARTVRKRLMTLAEGIPRLPALVRRRRLGTQVFASRSVSVSMSTTNSEAQNTRCIACTKGLRLSTFMRIARRCELCAYNVCSSCFSRENVETYNGRVEQIGVCKRCLEWVDRCNYSHIKKCGPAKVFDDSDRSLRGQSLRESLAVEYTKNATKRVIKMLLDVRSSNSTASNNTIELDDEEKCMTIVEEYFCRRSETAPAAEDCILANAQERTYPLHPTNRSSPFAPVPDNEVERLECIDKLGLMNFSDPVPELDVISSFLSREFGFQCAMITIIGESHLLVLSSSVPELVQTLIPREHTFCQHLLMGNAPFIIQNPEADIRFYNMDPVTLKGAMFYCGIPIVASHGIMVGSICCIHTVPMDITRSQYDTLKRFGNIASEIIKMKAEMKLQDH
ncbi:hypothetical protein PHMEG_0004010 [Phytophthora megakarya]|uniref:FYVE-type domain-containing protein n=1 Tax=Phytophthora megakarya TaxID=4795 RepID=A0A225WUV0_9STRA|nr:hypothetical protein PHMEG_0004010 [Phytophthora megakarya]